MLHLICVVKYKKMRTRRRRRFTREKNKMEKKKRERDVQKKETKNCHRSLEITKIRRFHDSQFQKRQLKSSLFFYFF